MCCIVRVARGAGAACGLREVDSSLIYSFTLTLFHHPPFLIFTLHHPPSYMFCVTNLFSELLLYLLYISPYILDTTSLLYSLLPFPVYNVFSMVGGGGVGRGVREKEKEKKRARESASSEDELCQQLTNEVSGLPLFIAPGGLEWGERAGKWWKGEGRWCHVLSSLW